MKHYPRSAYYLLAALPGLLLFALLLVWSSSLNARAAAVPDLTPTPSPTPAFSATLSVVPDRQTVLLGQMLAVTLAVDISEGCQYPVYDARLTQSGATAPNFNYIDPVSDTVGPPVAMPFTYNLLATAPGEVVLDGRLYGERYCGDFWNFTYITGSSPAIRVVSEWPYALRLPFIQGSPTASRGHRR